MTRTKIDYTGKEFKGFFVEKWLTADDTENLFRHRLAWKCHCLECGAIKYTDNSKCKLAKNYDVIRVREVM